MPLAGSCVSNRPKASARCNDSVLSGEDEGVDDLVALMIDYQAGRLEAFEGLYACLAPQLRRHFSRQVFAVYVEPPSMDELRQRLLLRDGVVGERYEHAKAEIEKLHRGEYDSAYEI